MIASVAAFFRIFNIILYGENGQIILVCNHICNFINIRRERAGDTDACNIVDIKDHIFHTGFIIVAFQFFYDAFRCFDTGFYVFNGIIFVAVLKFII